MDASTRVGRLSVPPERAAPSSEASGGEPLLAASDTVPTLAATPSPSPAASVGNRRRHQPTSTNFAKASSLTGDATTRAGRAGPRRLPQPAPPAAHHGRDGGPVRAPVGPDAAARLRDPRQARLRALRVGAGAVPRAHDRHGRAGLPGADRHHRQRPAPVPRRQPRAAAMV